MLIGEADNRDAGTVVFKYPPPPPPPPPILLFPVTFLNPPPPPPPAPKSWMFTDLAPVGLVQVVEPVVAKI
jgi:hypothetical protein